MLYIKCWKVGSNVLCCMRKPNRCFIILVYNVPQEKRLDLKPWTLFSWDDLRLWHRLSLHFVQPFLRTRQANNRRPVWKTTWEQPVSVFWIAEMKPGPDHFLLFCAGDTNQFESTAVCLTVGGESSSHCAMIEPCSLKGIDTSFFCNRNRPLARFSLAFISGKDGFSTVGRYWL